MSADLAERLLAFTRTLAASRARPGERLELSSPVFSQRLVDSMGVVELLAFVDREFGVSLDITMEELAELSTITSLARHIAQLRQAQPR
jgi:acyl carrier protein